MKLLVKMVSKMGVPYPLKVGKALVGNDVQRVAPAKPSVGFGCCTCLDGHSYPFAAKCSI